MMDPPSLKWVMWATGLAMLVFVATLFWQNAQTQRHNEQAQRDKDKAAIIAGFDDWADMNDASNLGEVSAEKWHAKRDAKKALMAAVANAHKKISIDGFANNHGRASVTIHNNNDFAVKDVAIVCTFYGASGTELSNASDVSYDIVDPSSGLRVGDLNFSRISPQATTVGCIATKALRVDSTIANSHKKISIDGFSRQGDSLWASLTIHNNNDFPVKNITVQCTTLDSTRRVELLKSTTTVYEIISPGAALRASDLNFGLIGWDNVVCAAIRSFPTN